MKQTMKLFYIGLRQIAKDGMLFVLLLAPFIMGISFKILIPSLNNFLEQNINFSLRPWYEIIDILLISISPMLTSMIIAFLILEERDEGVSMFYKITPVGSSSYLFARIGIPMIWTLFSTLIITLVFSISRIRFSIIFYGTILSTLMGISLVVMVVSLATNKVEGLALSKLMGLSLLGLLVVWLIPAPHQYMFFFLPSFWISKLTTSNIIIIPFIIGFFINLIWIFIFTRRFLNRIA